MPAIAAAALARICAEIELMPGDVGDRRHQRDVGRRRRSRACRPAATVETISLGTPTGSARIAAVAIAVLPEPPAASTPSKRPSACSRARERRGRVGHRPDRGAAVGQRAEVGAGLARDLLARDVGLAAARRAAGAGVGHEHVDAGEREALAQVGVLLALRVERADQQDGRASAVLDRFPRARSAPSAASRRRPRPRGSRPRASPRAAPRRRRRGSPSAGGGARARTCAPSR